MICKIVPEKCIACGLCQIKAPDYFDYLDNGLVIFKNQDTKEIQVDEPLPVSLLEAYRTCPTRAILLVEN